MAFADARIRSLETASLCVMLGACPRTIGWVTGLPNDFIRTKVYDAGHRAPRGRPPYTDDLVFKTTFKIQAEFGTFATKYRALTTAGFTPASSLIAAYQHYLSFTPVPSFSFDEAFFLVSNLDGIWACNTPTLQLEPCPRCTARRLVAHGGACTPVCAFCKEECGERGLRRRVAGRVPPDSGSIGVSAGLPLQIEVLRMQRVLESAGAHSRVVAAILSRYPDPGRRAPSRLVRIGKALPVSRWSSGVRTLLRAQFSIMASTFKRLVDCGIAPEQAITAAYRHVLAAFHRAPPLSFNRCFEVVCLSEGRWGVSEPTLQLTDCARCGSTYLESRADPAPQRCPFCVLLRHPEMYPPRAHATTPAATPRLL